MNHLDRHMLKTAQFAKEFGEYLNLNKEDISNLHLAALLHDVGKKMISENILNKKSKLTEEEYREIKLHPVYSRKILYRKKYNKEIINGVAHHHERVDGKGYPQGINGDKISLIGKILALCDSYEAMVGVREYRSPLTKEEALKEIEVNLGTQFDCKTGKNFIQFAEKNL